MAKTKQKLYMICRSLMNEFIEPIQRSTIVFPKKTHTQNSASEKTIAAVVMCFCFAPSSSSFDFLHCYSINCNVMCVCVCAKSWFNIHTNQLLLCERAHHLLLSLTQFGIHSQSFISYGHHLNIEQMEYVKISIWYTP